MTEKESKERREGNRVNSDCKYKGSNGKVLEKKEERRVRGSGQSTLTLGNYEGRRGKFL